MCTAGSPADLRSAGVEVIADLSGGSLRAVLEGEPSLVKVSDEELERDGWADSSEQRRRAARHRAPPRRRVRGASSCRAAPRPRSPASTGCCFEVGAPSVVVVDGRGGGDSMTGALGVAIGEGDADARRPPAGRRRGRRDDRAARAGDGREGRHRGDGAARRRHRPRRRHPRRDRRRPRAGSFGSLFSTADRCSDGLRSGRSVEIVGDVEHRRQVQIGFEAVFDVALGPQHDRAGPDAAVRGLEDVLAGHRRAPRRRARRSGRAS